MSTSLTNLDAIRLLQSLSPQARANLSQQCVWRRFAPGEEIISSEDESSDVLFIVDGRVQIVDYAPSGREVAYAEVGAGGHVGELSAIDGLPRSAAIIALTACSIAQLSATAFNQLLLREPDVAMAILRRLTEIIRAANEKITELSTVGAMQRVYRELLRLSEPSAKDDGSWVIANLPTQETMASRLGTTRETVARVLAQLARAKITERRGRTLFVHRPEQLEALADPSGDDW